MQAVLDAAIEQYRRDKFFLELDQDYARLQANPEAWQEELAERRLGDASLMDRLDQE